MSEALACGSEDVGGLLHLMLLVAGSLGVLDQRSLLFLAHFVKLFLGFFELAEVTDRGREGTEVHKDKFNSVLTEALICGSVNGNTVCK